VAQTFGWAPFGIEETIEPEIALEPLARDDLRVPAGSATGLRQHCSVMWGGSDVISLDYSCRRRSPSPWMPSTSMAIRPFVASSRTDCPETLGLQLRCDIVVHGDPISSDAACAPPQDKCDVARGVDPRHVERNLGHAATALLLTSTRTIELSGTVRTTAPGRTLDRITMCPSQPCSVPTCTTRRPSRYRVGFTCVISDRT